MKRRLFALATLIFCGVCAAWADENVAKIQERLRADGFYNGKGTGSYDSETAAAVTRFQIRNGLAITGKLDDATAKALGVAPAAGTAEPRVLPGTWRRLRNGDLQFVPKEEGKSARPAVASSPGSPSPAISDANAAVIPQANDTSSKPETERLRDYIAAFVLAGVDPHIGSELEFFASHVNYFGEANVSRDRIRRDLIRYDRAWPDRRFWLDGEIQVEQAAGNAIKVVFPLRYELRSGSKRAAGKVSKSLTLFRGRNNELEIIAVDERKA